MTKPRAAHPVADLFPMLAADELADLAADIKARGLLHPIVLDADGRVLDGRNRLAACQQADVTPTFVTYDGDDPDGYVLSTNLQRRNLTKGQQAMVAAQACKVSVQPTRKVAARLGMSAQRITQANVVIDYAPDLVDAVISGATGLDAAYTEARKRKEKAEGEEAQLASLREEQPDLADRVASGDLTLKGALAEAKERAEKARVAMAQGAEAAAVLVTRVRCDALTIKAAHEHGARLVNRQMITDLREAVDLLEGLL